MSRYSQQMKNALCLGKAVENAQKEICEKYDIAHYPSPPNLKVGVALNVREGITPINGLRHLPEGRGIEDDQRKLLLWYH